VTITEITSRAQALDEEEKPPPLVDGLDLDGLVFLLERAEERAIEAGAPAVHGYVGGWLWVSENGDCRKLGCREEPF